MNNAVAPMLVGIGLFGGLALAHEIGYIVGRRAKGRGKETAGLAAVQGAMLGLLGLLLAFSYAGAAQRFTDRQALLVREVNAVGTLHLRTEVLAEPSRGALRAAVSEYIRARIQLSDAHDDASVRELMNHLTVLQDRMWVAGRDGVASSPALAVVVLPAINDVLDLFAERNAAVDRHLPGLVLVLLFMSAAASVATVAYGFGLSGGRHLATMWALVLMIAFAMWVTIDLDYPRRGIIQMNLAPIEALKGMLSEPTPR
jgi:hypothetical protein